MQYRIKSKKEYVMKKLVLSILLSSVMALGVFNAYAMHDGGKAHDGMLKEADTNNDGKISLDEFKAQHEKHMQEMFKTLDTNSDGFIDEAERKAGHEKMREKMKSNCEPFYKYLLGFTPSN